MHAFPTQHSIITTEMKVVVALVTPCPDLPSWQYLLKFPFKEDLLSQLPRLLLAGRLQLAAPSGMASAAEKFLA